MSVYPNLLALKSIIETEYPQLLTNEGLAQLDEYVLAGPTSATKKSIGVYLGPGDESLSDLNFKSVVQLQLYKVGYEDALKYFSLLNDLIWSINPSLIGMQMLLRLSYTEYPPDDDSSTIFTFYTEYHNELDDCSNQDDE